MSKALPVAGSSHCPLASILRQAGSVLESSSAREQEGPQATLRACGLALRRQDAGAHSDWARG